MAKKIVIIGGGIAGLSAGIYAKLNGFDTQIIEMHSITGGQCTALELRLRLRTGKRFRIFTCIPGAGAMLIFHSSRASY